MRILLDLRGLVIWAYKDRTSEDTVLNAKGEPVPTAASGVKNFIQRTLLPILERTTPINIIGVLEGNSANARRRALLESYKNKPSDDALDEVQMREKENCLLQVQRLLTALGCPLVKTPYAEADDTIAYLCKGLKGGKIVYTVDNDLTQLHSPKVALMVKGEHKTGFKSMSFDEGVSPDMVVLYKSIVGDPSDQYVGVRGLGEKAFETLQATVGWDGMQELLDCVANTNYGPLKEAMEATNNKILRKLYDAREEWRVSYLLAKLHPEWCETSFGGKSTRPVWIKRVPTKERLLKVLEPLGLEALLPSFSKYLLKVVALDANSKVNWKSLYSTMRDSMAVAFDYESFDKNKFDTLQKAKPGYVDVLSQEVTGVSACFGDNLQYAIYVPVNHRDTANFPPEKILEIIKEIDTHGQRAELVAHNASFEQVVTKTNYGYTFNRMVLDTATMGVYEDEEELQGLKYASKRVLNYDQVSYQQLVGPDMDMRDLSLPEVLSYGTDDSICSAHLYVLRKMILEVEGTWDFYKENEPYFDREMMKTFIKGTKVDFEEMALQEREDEALRKTTTAELRGLLEKHCLEVNEEGFTTLWAEIEPYEREKALKKAEEAGVELNKEELEGKIEALQAETLAACQYTPLSPAKILGAKPLFSRVARFLNFPSVRSLKPEYVSTYVKGIRDQAEEQKVELSDSQKEFLQLLSGNMLELYDFCLGVMESAEELWEGDELNIGSPKQMAQLFYGKMGLPVLLRNVDKNKVKPNKRTCWDLEQAPSVDILAIETWMAELSPEDWKYQVLDKVKTLRGIQTKFSLYYKPYPLFKRPDTGMVHPGIKNCGTVTKRPSGTSPNPFQWSKKDGAKFRRVIVPYTEDEVICSIDFEQQELVVLAGLSDDKNLRSCYQGNNKKDVHSLTGMGILNLQLVKLGQRPMTYEEFVKAKEDKKSLASVIRKKPAKITNFLMVYGGSSSGLSRKATVPKKVAESWVDAFFETYPGVKSYQDRMISEVRKFGFVKTAFGTRRHLTGAFSTNKAVAAASERQGINAPIQGTCADLLKKLMREVVLSNLTERLGATIIAPVYDEILASVPKARLVEWIQELSSMMEIFLPGLNIGLTTSVSIGLNAGDQVELGSKPSREVIEKALGELQ